MEDLTFSLAGAALWVVVVLVLLALSVRLVHPRDERLVVYRLGSTGKRLIRGWGDAPFQIVLVIPLIDRVVRVQGDLMTAWLAVADALPDDWQMPRPVEDRARGVWVVRAFAPKAGSADREGIEAMGSTEALALHEVAARLRAATGDP